MIIAWSARKVIIILNYLLREVKDLCEEEESCKMIWSSLMKMMMMIMIITWSARKVIIILNHLLRVVKESCEEQESCKIIPSETLAKHSKCNKVGWLMTFLQWERQFLQISPGVTKSMMMQVEERKLWVQYTCNGGEDNSEVDFSKQCNERSFILFK